MDGLSVKGRVEAFDNKHGRDCVVFDSWLLFADGASREIDPFGLLAEPPQDVYKCNQFKVKYHTIKLELAAEEFSVLKQSVMAHTKVILRDRSCSGAPGREAVERLKELQKKVRACQRNLDEAKDNLEKSKPACLIQREVSNEHNRRKAEEFLSEIEKIEI